MFEDDTSVLPQLRGDEPAMVVAKVIAGEEAAVEGALAAMDAGATEEDKERASKVSRMIPRVELNSTRHVWTILRRTAWVRRVE